MSDFSNINFEAKSRITGDDTPFRNAKVKVFGVGGAGGNTVNRMKQMNIEGVEYYAVNTDAMALDQSLADHKILIGEKSTRNLGAGMDPEMGRKAVEENIDDLRNAMKGADLVFVTAGMGGGTGTGAAPVVANIAREEGVLTVAVVTKPFRFEGNVRNSLAQRGVDALREAADTIIVIENKKLLNLIQNTNKSATVDEAFKMADEILGNAVQSICSIMFRHGLVHVDFADIRKVMLKGGSALMGTGTAEGEGRGVAAADSALSSPLLEDIDIKGASGVLINVSHGENYSLLEHNEAMEHIYDAVGEEGCPNIIVGDITLPELGDKVCITIIATGCGGTNNAAAVGYAGIGSVAYQQAQAYQQPAPVQAATPRPTTNFLALAGRATAAMPTAAPTVAAQTVSQRVASVPASAMSAAQTPSYANSAPTQAYAAAPSYAAPTQSYAASAPNYGASQTNSYAAPTRQASAAPVNLAAAMFSPASSFASPNFDANKAGFAEETVPAPSASSMRESEEMPAAAEADPLSNGSSYAGAYAKQEQRAEQNDYMTPAFKRNQSNYDDALKESNIDYEMPAFMRMNSDLF
ncbi:cell division protein FtsZ [Fibrobacter sp.]|uniref:cell division protein FtsZ n=1 Tax=Fibrobacter sp. TaxID=35828 RepID=UPI0025BFF3EE|nr:cell division protein FtsZ [Fibrobacter sp.]MBR3072543.1 cell division protein FtsZ [Fibrobacter sp.]